RDLGKDGQPPRPAHLRQAGCLYPRGGDPLRHAQQPDLRSQLRPAAVGVTLRAGVYLLNHMTYAVGAPSFFWPLSATFVPESGQKKGFWRGKSPSKPPAEKATA